MSEPHRIQDLHQPPAFGELASLYRLTDRLYRATSVSEIFEAAIDAISETLHCDRASILLFDSDGVMDFVAWRGLSERYRSAVRGHSPWKHGDRDPSLILVPDIEQTNEPPDIKSAVSAENIRGLAFIPLMVHGAVAGKFMAYYAAPRIFSEHERDLAVMIARQVGFGLERAKADEARQESEAALRESEERFRLMSENAPVMIWMSDENGGCLHLNRMLREFWGVDERDLAGFDWRTSMHPEDVESIGAAIWNALRARTSVEIRGRYTNSAGEYRVLLTNAHPRFAPNGRFLGMIGVNVDVTERERAQQELRELNRTLEERVSERTAERDRIWKNTQDLQIILDANGVVRSVNPAVTRVLGWPAEAMIGRSAFDFVFERDLTGSREALGQARSGLLPSRENRCLHADGSYRWIAWVAAPEGDLIYASGRDITQEKTNEKALAKAEEALRQAQKMEAIGQLTGGIAHDFNNLLQGLVASLELIRRRPEDGEAVKRFAEAGLKAAQRGSKLTSQLLAFSRAQKLELKPVDIGALIANMRELLERTLGPAVRVSLELESGALRALGDEVQLEMAVLNLAINARDAMPNGGKLTIRARPLRVVGDPELPDGRYLEMSVSDTGEGMPPDVAARAFDPFFTTKGVGKGTGLGLSQVYGIARQAGGTARIDSRPGEGTTVRVLLQHTGARGAAAAGAMHEPMLKAAAARIMVVDDDADVRSFLCEMLRALGFETCEAADGDAALAALDRARPDAMILDFAMPGRNGAEVARAVRERHPDLPIVFASGFSDTAAIDAVESNAKLLRKPFGAEELRAALADVLGNGAKATPSLHAN